MSQSVTIRHSRATSMAYLSFSYLAAIAAAFFAGYYVREMHPLWVVAIADIVGTIVIFLFSRAFNNSSFYDPYWSVIPILIAFYFIIVSAQEVPTIRQVLVFGLVVFWGVRLTHNFLRGWPGIHHEDWRYADFRKNTGRWYWLVSFLGIHLFPTVMVFAGCLALYPALQYGSAPFGLLDVVALLITLGAVIIELIADNQLRSFVNRKDKKQGEIMQSGIWAYSRHPNYFGEVSFWWGLFLFAMAADPGAWFALTGPAIMTILFVFISIPMIDKRSMERRAGYREHMSSVSALIPWFPAKKT